MNEHYITYIRWYCTPAKERQPKTIEEFMQLYSLTGQDMIAFSENPTFYQDLQREARNWGYSKLPELIHIAHENARAGGRPSALKVFKELLEDDQSKGPTINVININPGSKQYQQIVEREAKKLNSPNDDNR